MNRLGTAALILGATSFIIVIGGAVYEHLAVVPIWSTAVPASLAMFQGEYGLRAQNFWIPIHPVTIVLLIAAAILNWRTVRRMWILIPIVGYAIVLIITSIYFVPELLAITQSPYELRTDAGLTSRANLWEALSLVRLGFLLVLAVLLLLGLSRPVERIAIAER